MTSKPLSEFNPKYQNVLIYLGVFIVAICARLYFALLDGHSVLFNACDAAEYLASAAKIQQFLNKPEQFWIDSLKCLAGTLSVEDQQFIHSQYRPLLDVVQRSGPVYPMFLLFATNFSPSSINSDTTLNAVILQCFLTAASCVLVSYCGCKIWNNRVGLAAGILSAIYPAFIISSARLISESFAMTLITVILALSLSLLYSVKSIQIFSFLIGFFLSLAQLTRSALLVVSAATFATVLALCRQPSARWSLLFMGLGFATTICSFTCLQFLITGKATALVDRMSLFNLFLGQDLSSQGWFSYPYSNFAVMNSGYFGILNYFFQQNPIQFLELLYNKPARLYSLPWNDFCTPIGLIDKSIQVLFHRTCLMLAVLGIVHEFKDGNFKSLERKNIARCFLILIFLVHFAYVFFQAQPRYVATAVPIILIFSGLGAVTLIEGLRTPATRKYFAALVFCSGLLLLATRQNWLEPMMNLSIINLPTVLIAIIAALKILLAGLVVITMYLCVSATTNSKTWTKILSCFIGFTLIPYAGLPLQCFGINNQWSYKLSSSRSARQTVCIPNSLIDNLSSKQFLLIIDCQNWKTLGQSAELFLNGNRLSETAIPLMPLFQNLQKPHLDSKGYLSFEAEKVFSSVMTAAGGSCMDAQQWFVIPISDAEMRSAIKYGSNNFDFELKASKDLDTYIYGSYLLKRNQITIPSINKYSWDKMIYGVESSCAFSEWRYPQVIKTMSPDKAISPASLNGINPGLFNIRLLTVPKQNDDGINEQTLIFEDSTQTAGLSRTIAAPITAPLDDSLYIATFSGMLRSELKEKVTLPVNIEAFFNSHGELPTQELKYNSPWVPSSILISNGVNRIQFSVPIHANAFKKNVKSIQISIKPGGLESENQFYSTFSHFKQSGKQLEKLERVKFCWQSSKIKLSKLPVRVPIQRIDSIF